MRQSQAAHCESGEVLWLKRKAALQTHCFREAEPQSVIPLGGTKNHGMSLMTNLVVPGK